MTCRTAVLLSAILLAAGTRWLPHPPSFAPITAMAVFATARLADRRLAVATPLVALFISDLGLEVLNRMGLVSTWGLYRGMWIVYAATLAVGLLGFLIRRTRSPLATAVVLLAGSCLFFVVTNFGVWAADGLYPETPEGLLLCYTAALPFFQNALLGDCVYGAVLLGGFALAEARFPSLRRQAELRAV
jgi:hypothetical protein